MNRFLLSSNRLIAKKAFSTSVVPNKLFDKILIANRGEIACRVIRTARKLGVKTVAVYSDADRNSEHVKLADEAVYIGNSPASESYLRGDRIIEAMKKTGAQAVHPGYGFLSENLNFCQMCTDANVVFIGPPPQAIKSMGSKSESKDIMIKAGVPVTPGYHGDKQDNETLFRESKNVGYPLMIKAVSGGGGKGMRAVYEESKFLESLDSCRREAMKSFSDDKMLIEKLVQAPRHVELQVFGDQHGGAVHLMERDCSIQRRHQKVLEEAPAPNLPPKMRKAMGDAAVACAKAVGYVGAGTVEFLVDSITNDFYFCEMNTRLQVEHPVTEMITGIDLVEWQLRTAAGQKIPLTQEQIIEQCNGCAIEARIYAENPLQGFLPTTGHIVHMKTPVDNKFVEDSVRVDSGIKSGSEVSTFYDPMIAKLIVHAADRPAALRKLERALRDFHVSGLANNIDFLVKIVRHPGFTEKQATTAFFDFHMNELLKSVKPPPLTSITNHSVLGVVGLMEAKKLHSSNSAPWGGINGNDWRGFSNVKKSINICDLDSTMDLQVESGESNSFKLLNNVEGGESVSCNIKSKKLVTDPTSNGLVWNLGVEIEGHLVEGTVAIYNNSKGDEILDIWIEGQAGESPTHAQLTIPVFDLNESEAASGAPIVRAPMPGKVIKVLVKDGQLVKRGDTVVILEAMKMEHEVTAPCDGVVTLFCSEGVTVGDGNKLIQIEFKE